MNFKCRSLLLLSGLMSFAMGNENTQATSIFVHDPAYFHQRQIDLQKMQQDMGSANEALDSLLIQADKVAQMSDKCTVVSINDVMDESCWTFYQVELPAFEQLYTKVTGEVRLGYMETVRSMQDRKLQIDACANALTSVVFSKEENLDIEGGVSLEPLAKGIEASYDFTYKYQQEHRKQMLEIAKVWGETCKDMVTRQDGVSFAPFFVEQLERLNKELNDRGSLAVIKLDSSAAPTIYVDIAKPVRSAYYLNGNKIFHSRLSSSSAENSNLRITFTKDGVIAGGEAIVKKPNGSPVQYKGSIQLAEGTTRVDGRWFLEGNGNNEGVDFGPDYDEDSLAVAKAEEAEREQIAAQNIAAEKAAEEASRKGLHFSFWAGITGDIVNYTDRTVCAYMNLVDDVDEVKNTCKSGYTFFMPDIGAAARLKYNFGPNNDMFVTAGVGGMYGLAFASKEKFESILKRSYAGLLGQFEVGYKNFGIRETMIFHIVIDDAERWNQFRTGAFYGFNVSNKVMLNLELGFTYINNAGNGFYAGVGTTF